MLLDEQKRQLTLALQPVEPIEQGVDYNRGQAFERLVHQQQCRIAHQGTPDHHWNWRLSWASSISSSPVGNDCQQPCENQSFRHFHMSTISTLTGDRPSLNVVGQPRAVGAENDCRERSVVLCVCE